MTLNKKIIYVVVSVILIAGIFGGGVYVGYENRPAIEKITGIFNKETEKPENVDFSPFWKAWSVIQEKYVSNNGEDEQKMVWGAIEGAMKSLGDPYTTFFPPVENKKFKDEMRGDFSGVGMEVGMRGGSIIVIAPLKGTPASKAGVKAGDKIFKIDELVTTDMTVEEAVSHIKGPKGTTVKLTMLRKDVDKPVEISIVRDIIQIPVLETESKPDGIFVVKLYSFSETSADKFRTAMREFVFSGNDKLLLDLRGNPGGYLESAVDMASWFLPKDAIVVRERLADGKELPPFRSNAYNIFNNKLKMVILVDGGSASASEILAGALSEHGIAKLVGMKTFGKGSVQELVPITADTSLKVTIARWLTPNGNSISEKGIEPDVKVEITEKDIEANKDPQMDKAVEVLKKL